jgi:hypothetical protein
MDLGTQKVKAAIVKDGIIVVEGQTYSGFNLTIAAKTAFDVALKQLNLQLQDIECSATSGLRFRPYSCRWARGGIFYEGNIRERAEIIGGG